MDGRRKLTYIGSCQLLALASLVLVRNVTFFHDGILITLFVCFRRYDGHLVSVVVINDYPIFDLS